MPLGSVDPTSGSAKLGESTLDEQLQAMFDYNPHCLVTDPNCQPPSITSPLSFYDKHIDKTLILKRVKILSTLPIGISTTVDSALQSLKDRGIALPLSAGFLPTLKRREYDDRRNEAIYDANSVADFYESTSARYCHYVASTLFLAQTHALAVPEWTTFLYWRNDRRENAPRRSHTIKCSLQFDDHKLQVDDILGEDIKASLLQVSKRFPKVAIWMTHTVSEQAEHLLKRMDDASLSKTFTSQVCMAKCHMPVSEALVPNAIFDSRNSPWTIPSTGHISKPSFDGPSRNTRSRKAASTLLTVSPKVPLGNSFAVPSRKRGQSRRDTGHSVDLPANDGRRQQKATPESILQHVSPLQSKYIA